ncbi:unnamed protein product [Sphagnum balticum]
MDRMAVMEILDTVRGASDVVIIGRGSRAKLSCSIHQSELAVVDFTKWRLVNEPVAFREAGMVRIVWIQPAC